MLSAAVRGCNLHVRAGGQRDWRPNCRAGGSLVGGVNLAGMASALAVGSDVQGHAV